MSKPSILVTGANGQLGREIRVLAESFPEFDFIFLSRDDLPIHHSEHVYDFFDKVKPSYCINCAAYTAVDKAEGDREMAFLVNGESVGVLATVCKEHGAKFIHISTDYVFDGRSSIPYTENAATNPINVYGESKWQGELLCKENNPDAIIIRTAWVYSAFGNNFVKTMLRMMNERSVVNVVNDQVGCPTYARDLAESILKIISVSSFQLPLRDDVSQSGVTSNQLPIAIGTATSNWRPGLYHYSNTGRISWYDFALAIKELTGAACLVHPIPGSQYPTPAERPSFSLLDTQKIREAYGITIPGWKDSLQQCLIRLHASSS